MDAHPESKNYLLQHLVPTGDWQNTIENWSGTPGNVELLKTLPLFYRALLDQDRSIYGQLLTKIVENLVTGTQPQIGALNLLSSDPPLNIGQTFARLIPFFGGVITASLDLLMLDDETTRQLAIYIAIKAARHVSLAERLPNGYNSQRIDSTFTNYFQCLNVEIFQQKVRAAQQMRSATTAPSSPVAHPRTQSEQSPLPPVSSPAPSIHITISDKTHPLVPVFHEIGIITQTERRTAMKMATRVKIPEGPYVGITDKRPIRRVLTWIKDTAVANYFTAVEYQALLFEALDDSVRRTVPQIPCDSHEQLAGHLTERITALLKHYAPSEHTEILQAKTAFHNLRQGETEQLLPFVGRFDTTLQDLTSLGTQLSTGEICQQFKLGLNSRFKEKATLLHLTNPQMEYTTLRAELITLAGTQNKLVISDEPKTSLKANTHSTTTNTSTTGTTHIPTGTCYRCGGDHYAPTCTVPKDVKCDKCAKTGHLAKACGMTKNRTTAKPNRRPGAAETYSIEVISAETAQVFSSQAPILACKLGHLENQQVLLDSGATCGLLSKDLFDELTRHTRYKTNEVLANIVYAKGTPSQANTLVHIPVTYHRKGVPLTKTVPFLVVPGLNRPAVLGRQAMSIIGISMVFGSPAPDDDNYDDTELPPIEICMASSEQYCTVSDYSGTETTEAPRPATSDITIASQVADQLAQARLQNRGGKLYHEISEGQIHAAAYDILGKIAALGPLAFAEGYTIHLEPVDTHVTDTPEQKFFFKVAWNIQQNQRQVPTQTWNSTRSIDKLAPAHRSEWNSHLQNYMEHQWWSRSVDPPNDHDAVVFPVVQKDTKTTTCRPCSDFRTLNALSPRISATTTEIPHAVLQLRSQLYADTEVFQSDLSKAFYRIRVQICDEQLKSKPLTLKAGHQRFTSDRLVFGLSAGPSGLNCSQTILQTAANELYHTLCSADFEPSKLIIVMDDFLFIGPSQINAFCVRVFDTFWRLTGFESPADKRYAWNRNAPVRWLGGQWLWDSETEHLRFIRPEITFPEMPKFTKRVMFQIAGKVNTVTCSLQEALARTHCDALRSLSGSEEHWDTTITDKSKISQLRSHIFKMKEHYAAACTERTLVLTRSVPRVTLHADASLTGFGFVLVNSDDPAKHILYAYGRIFNKQQWPWHINRKELFSLSRAIQQLDSILYSFPKLTHVTCHTDSRVALAQTNAFKEISSKSIERRVLLRLRRGILELLGAWHRYGIEATIAHIATTQNLADQLSRITAHTFDDTEYFAAEVAFDRTLSTFRLFQPYQNWIKLQQMFCAWRTKRGSVSESDISLRRFLHTRQSNDQRCTHLMELLHTQAQGERSINPEVRFLSMDGELLIRTVDTNEQVYIADSIVVDLFHHIHTQQGHCGIIDLLHAFYQCSYHPHARKLAKSTLRRCETCQRSKSNVGQQTSYGPVHRPAYPFEVIGVDLFGPLARAQAISTGKYIFTLVDRLTGYTMFNVVKNGKSSTIARTLENILYQLGQRVKVCVNDNAVAFSNGISFRSVLTSWNIRSVAIPIYTPSVGGFYERKHATAVHCLRTILLEHPLTDWQLMATIAAGVINSHPSPDRSGAPHQLLFGYEYTWPTVAAIQNAISPPEIDRALQAPVASDDVANEAHKRHTLRQKLLALWNEEFETRQTQTALRFISSVPSNRETLQIGDQVFFANDTIKRKFSPHCEGPFTLREQLGHHTWLAQDENSQKQFKFHASRLRKFQSEIPVKLQPPLHQHDPDTPPPTSRKSPTQKKCTSIRPRPASKEQRFLSAISGAKSRTGRVRRGSVQIIA